MKEKESFYVFAIKLIKSNNQDKALQENEDENGDDIEDYYYHHFCSVLSRYSTHNKEENAGYYYYFLTVYITLCAIYAFHSLKIKVFGCVLYICMFLKELDLYFLKISGPKLNGMQYEYAILQ